MEIDFSSSASEEKKNLVTQTTFAVLTIPYFLKDAQQYAELENSLRTPLQEIF